MRNRRNLVVASFAVLAVVGAACGGDSTTPANGNGGPEIDPNLTGSIFVSGSSTVEPISGLVAELFSEQAPNVDITVEGPGTGDGFELFCAGETEVSDASRPIDEDEIALCEEAGIEFVELEVALDGISVLTSPDNADVTCLNHGDLYALSGPESEGFESWADANELAADVDGTGSFPDVPLEITGPGEESGTYDAYIELSGIADLAEERGLPEAKWETTRVDYQASPDDNVIIQGISGSPTSFGWVGFAFYQSNTDTVKAIEIDGGDGCVAPTFDTIADGSYPLSRSLYIYVNTAKAAENPALAAYVDHYMSDEGLQLAVEETQYVPLPEDRIEATRSAWEEAAPAA